MGFSKSNQSSSLLREARKKFLSGIRVPEKTEFQIDDFQQEAISYVVEGADTLVVAPTGSGKTFIALEAITANLHLGGKSIYTTPLKALSNTKYTELKNRFEPQFKVGLLTGDRKIDTDADVVIATTEIYRNELYRGMERFSLVILDEVHFIADPQRGPVWEESIILTPSGATLLMLSASISNYGEISDWLTHVRGKACKVVIKKERPVELRHGFLHPDYGVLPLSDDKDHVFKEVNSFYGSLGLDASGMRLKSPRRSEGRSKYHGSRKKGRGRGK